MLKPHRQAFDILKKALKQVTEDEREEEKKDAAKELIRKALDLQARMDRAEHRFNAEKQTFDAELRETLNRLRDLVAGRPLDDGKRDSKGDGLSTVS
jgi:hypothetical protein